MQVEVEVIETSKEAFVKAMELIFLNNYKYSNQNYTDKVYYSTGYKIVDNELFLSQSDKNITPFAYEFNMHQTIEFAWGWLESQKPSYGEPDTDGDTGLGFEVTTKKSGWRNSDYGFFVSMRRVWMIYGK